MVDKSLNDAKIKDLNSQYDDTSAKQLWRMVEGSRCEVRDDAKKKLYVATDFGVVRGNNDGRGDWRVTPDLPRFEITHLEIQPSARVPTCVGLSRRNCPTLIYAATHSQGMWRLDLGGP